MGWELEAAGLGVQGAAARGRPSAARPAQEARAPRVERQGGDAVGCTSPRAAIRPLITRTGSE
jgi:hypothetical protein